MNLRENIGQTQIRRKFATETCEGIAKEYTNSSQLSRNTAMENFPRKTVENLLRTCEEFAY